MITRTQVGTVLGVALLALTLTQYSTASTADRMSYLTFSGPVSLPGVTLGAGTYVFELALPFSQRNVVRVMSRDRRISYYMGFTRTVDRPSGLPAGAAISLGESPRNQAPPITAWWPMGETQGHEFLYSRR